MPHQHPYKLLIFLKKNNISILTKLYTHFNQITTQFWIDNGWRTLVLMLCGDLNHIAQSKSHVINKLGSTNMNTNMNTGTCMGTIRGEMTIFEKLREKMFYNKNIKA